MARTARGRTARGQALRTAPVVPAYLERDAAGVSRAPEFGDIYHPRHGALEQAHRVFLGGNALPVRWQDRERFVILETGFGLGNNFLATWSAWRDDARRCPQLRFLSIELRPPSAGDLAAVPRDPRLGPLAAQLAAAWPPLTCNLHRLSFESGQVQLLLAFGDVAAWLPQIEASVDAFFLDGFAPAKNPAMWQPRLFKAMARIAAPQATAATWSSARAVRDGFRAAGFEWTRADGSGGKRDITVARFAPCFVPRARPRRPGPAPAHRDEPVLIVGAGLAGCATAWALAEQGRRSILLERGPTVAGEGSGNPAGIFHGVVHRDDGRHARCLRAAALEGARQVTVAVAEHCVAGAIDGLLRLETGHADVASMQAVLDRLGLPPEYVRAVTPEQASALAGTAIAAPAWFYPRGGWVDPGGLARSYLERGASRVALRTGVEVATLRRDANHYWRLFDAAGTELASATTVVLANAGGASRLLGSECWPIEQRRGQLSSVAAARWPASTRPRLPIAGSGYVLPPLGGRIWFGATSRNADVDLAVRNSDHDENLGRLGALLGGAPAIGLDALEGRVSFRYASIDRLPLIGAVPATALGPQLREGVDFSVSPRPEQPRFAPRAPGLFVFTALGSRGITWSALGAQVVASAITGAPAPLESDLLDAIDPARFDSRSFRRAGTAAEANQWPDGARDAGSTGA
jgi:tRNA 5-methylaminomethyl-2-thiouridine biosynthesis bifunctional protein